MPQPEEAPVENAPVEAPQAEAMPQEEGMSFEEAMQAALNEDVGEAVEVLVDPEAPAEPVEAAPATEEPVEAPEEVPQTDRSLARIMEREAKLLEQQKRLDDAQPQLEELRGRVERYESAQTSFTQDPVSFIRSLAPDMDLKRVAESLWYEAQGDAAPQAYLQKKAATQHNSELAERIAKIEQGDIERQRQEQENAAQKALAQYQGSLESFATQASTESYPLVTAMQGKNPGWVQGTMLDIARHLTQANRGAVPTPEQVTQELERHIGTFQIGATPATQETPPAREEGTSLRNNSTQVQPDREPEDELSDEYLRKKAFEAMGAPNLF